MSLADDIADWIRGVVHDASAEGVVVGLSGGIDSAVTAVLARRALSDNVLAAILPCESEPEDAEDAHLIASTFGIETLTIDLTAAYRALVGVLPEAEALVRANIKPRLRMIALYYLAASRACLVCGASNRSERMIGYFTKHGDSAADLLPLGGLLKFEVRQLARDLGIPNRILAKPPSAGLWPGQTDEGEMGLSYGLLDSVLRAMDRRQFDAVPAAAMTRVRQLMSASAHKRGIPPIFVPRREG